MPGPDGGILQGRLNSESLANLESLLGHLSDCQAELTDLITDFQSCFADTDMVGETTSFRMKYYSLIIF